MCQRFHVGKGVLFSLVEKLERKAGETFLLPTEPPGSAPPKRKGSLALKGGAPAAISLKENPVTP